MLVVVSYDSCGKEPGGGRSVEISVVSSYHFSGKVYSVFVQSKYPLLRHIYFVGRNAAAFAQS